MLKLWIKTAVLAAIGSYAVLQAVSLVSPTSSPLVDYVQILWEVNTSPRFTGENEIMKELYNEMLLEFTLHSIFATLLAVAALWLAVDKTIAIWRQRWREGEDTAITLYNSEWR
jgi:hypothetical protein